MTQSQDHAQHRRPGSWSCHCDSVTGPSQDHHRTMTVSDGPSQDHGRHTVTASSWHCDGMVLAGPCHGPVTVTDRHRAVAGPSQGRHGAVTGPSQWHRRSEGRSAKVRVVRRPWYQASRHVRQQDRRRAVAGPSRDRHGTVTGPSRTTTDPGTPAKSDTCFCHVLVCSCRMCSRVLLG